MKLDIFFPCRRSSPFLLSGILKTVVTLTVCASHSKASLVTTPFSHVKLQSAYKVVGFCYELENKKAFWII